MGGSLMTYSLVSMRVLMEALVGLPILACQNEILFECNVKKRLAIFPSPAGMSLIKLSPAGNPGQGKFVL